MNHYDEIDHDEIAAQQRDIEAERAAEVQTSPDDWELYNTPCAKAEREHPEPIR